MSEHYIVTVDRGRLRIYAEVEGPEKSIPRLQIVEAIDFPSHTGSTREDDGDAEGANVESSSRFSGSTGEISAKGRGKTGRNEEMLAVELDTFLQNRPEATWDFAAAPSLYHSIIEQLSPATRRRVKRALSKTMTNQRADEVRASFAAAGR